MLNQGQKLKQSQSLQQKLSPQQIQYIKLLQLPTIGLEQRIKEELEINPVLEEADPSAEQEILDEQPDSWEEADAEEVKSGEDETDPVDQNEEIDWEELLENREYEGNSSGSYSAVNEEWRDLPNPYHESLLEELEQQVSLLDLDETEKLIAAQILGSLDEDGYFRRDVEAVVDNIAFNEGTLCRPEDVEKVRCMIQRLEPVGIASRDLQDCLRVQLEVLNRKDAVGCVALKMVRDEWKAFERKHFDKLLSRLDVDGDLLKQVFTLVRSLDPRPGAVANPEEDSKQYIEPDFEVYFEPGEGEDGDETGDFVIRLNHRNMPSLRISPSYKEMWDGLKSGGGGDARARTFIKEKIDSAQWFIESIRQRQQTLMMTMQTIVALQEDFFKYGEGLKPMILKDVAERVHLDISTISRVVNGKYVQTAFGVYELKYFFTEGLETESGEDVSSREVKNLLQSIIDGEDKSSPLSDQALTDMLKEKGFRVARRTVSKYREQLNVPVARLRKQII